MWSHGMHVPLGDKVPQVAEGAFIAPNATLVGEVIVEAGASVWFGAVLRADDGPIHVAAGANVQDNVVIHVGPDRGTYLAEDVSVGHNAILHSCVVGRGSVIGMGACVQERAVIGAGSLVAAGAVVTEGFEVPDGHTAGGVPARVFGALSDRSRYFVEMSAGMYRDRIARYTGTATWVPAGAAR